MFWMESKQLEGMDGRRVEMIVIKLNRSHSLILDSSIIISVNYQWVEWTDENSTATDDDDN